MFRKLKERRARKRLRTNPEPGFRPMSGRHYHDVLIEVEKRIAPDWYVEIGSRTGTSIAHRSCSFVAIDPVFQIEADVFNSSHQMHFIQQTSDAFFASGFFEKLGILADFAFIDGMHQFEFALRDFINLEKVMASDGLVFLHDVCPYDHSMAGREPSADMPGAWTGDVWKTIVILTELRPDLRVEVLNAASTGLACVRTLDPQNTTLTDEYDAIVARYRDVSLADYGVEDYYRLVAPRDPDDFLAELSPRPS